MFLLVSVRHVGAHPGEHQHGVSIQISINLGKTFLRLSRVRKIPLTWNLARVFAYLPPFISQILDLIYRTVLIFILIYFEWRDTENQQYQSHEPGWNDVIGLKYILTWKPSKTKNSNFYQPKWSETKAIIFHTCSLKFFYLYPTYIPTVQDT